MEHILLEGKFGRLSSVSQDTILDYLSGKGTASIEMEAIFSWAMPLVSPMFLLHNPTYIRVYKLMGGDMEKKIQGQKYRLSGIYDPVSSELEEGATVASHYGVDATMFKGNLPESMLEEKEVVLRLFKYERYEQIDFHNPLHMECLYEMSEDLDTSALLDKKIDSFLSSWTKGDKNPDHMRTLVRMMPDPHLSISLARFGDIYCLGYKTPEMQAYMTGYPLHEMCPKTISLCSGDRTSTLLRIREYNSCRLSSMLACTDPYSATSTMHVKDSVYGDPILYYSPFDIVTYIGETGNIIRLCRPEFRYVLMRRVDPYEKKTIPSMILDRVRERQDLAKKWNLPDSRALNVLLEHIERVPKKDNNEDSDKCLVC